MKLYRFDTLNKKTAFLIEANSEKEALKKARKFVKGLNLTCEIQPNGTMDVDIVATPEQKSEGTKNGYLQGL
jgi:hypothetical protein